MDDYRIIIDPREEDEFNIAGIYVKVLQISDNKVDPEDMKYDTKLEAYVTPFSIKNNTKSDSEITLTEVIGDLNLEQIDYEIPEIDPNTNEPKIPKIIQKKPVKTTVSRGYSLNIPTLGNILLTHNGDVILKIYDLSRNGNTNKSLHIETPKQVILNLTNAPYLNLDVVASTICISRGDKASLKSLSFRTYSISDITRGLFIDINCLLFVSTLKLKNSLLLCLGRLSIIDECDIDGGYIFNHGEIKMSSLKNNIKELSFFMNGTEANFNPLQISVETNAFSNLGNIQSHSMSLKIENAFDNQGTINVNKILEINGDGEALNAGFIKNQDGTVVFQNYAFYHQAGEISAKTIKFLTNFNQIQSIIKGDEAIFCNDTIIRNFEENIGFNQPLVNLRKAVITGNFLNQSFFCANEILELNGEKTEVQNIGLISTMHIISNANEATIQQGKVDAIKITVNNGLLATKSTFEKLEIAEVEFNGELFFPNKDNNIRELKEIKNKGKLKILSNIPQLKTIENDEKAQLRIEVSCDLDNVKSINKIRGEAVFLSGVKFRNVTNFDLPSGAKMYFGKGSHLSKVETLIVRKGSFLEFEKGTFYPMNLRNIFNFGTCTFPSSLFSLSLVYNGPGAELNLLDGANVKNCSNENSNLSEIIKEYPQILSKYKSYLSEKATDSTFGVFNEGSILVKSLSIEKTKPTSFWGDIKSFFQNVPNDESSFYVRKGLRVYSNYVSSEESVLRLDDYTLISAYDFINHGVIYSPEKMRLDVISDISRFGIVASDDGIDINLKIDNFVLDKTFCPVARNQNKQLNIKTDGSIEIFDNNNYNTHLNIESKSLFVKGSLIAQSLDLTTREFCIEKGINNKYEFSFKEKFNIKTRFFMNNGGIIQQQDEDKVSKIIVANLFQNTGGGDFSKDHKMATYYDQKNKQSNSPRLDKSGLIATGGSLEIIVGAFDNCFGLINGISGLKIESSSIINNECGVILSSGKTELKGVTLDNGYYQFINESRSSGYKSLPSYFIMRSRNGYYNSNSTNTTLTTSYSPYYSSASSLFPGYIFSTGDLIITMEKPCYIGTLVSEGDIYFKSQRINFRTSNEFGTLIARGNITAEIQNARLEQFNIQARNILIKMVETLRLNGVIRSFTRYGNTVDIINLVEFGKYFGYLINDDTFRSQGDTRTGLLNLISLSADSSKETLHTLQPTKNVAFMKSRPQSNVFLTSISDSILNQLVRLTLTPFSGRDILLRIDLINELNRSGLNLLGSFTTSRNIILKNGDPALIYEKIKDQEIEMEIEGEKVLVPICNPYLIISTVNRMMTKLKGEESVTLHTKGDIEFRPGKLMEVETPNLYLESEGQVTIASQYKYEGRRKAGVNVANLHFPGSMTLSGKQGVTIKGANISAGNKLSIKSENGDIVDYSMVLDPKFKFYINKGKFGFEISQDVHTSVLSGKGVELKGKSIKQNGTIIKAGTDGVKIEANKYNYEAQKTFYYKFEIRSNKQSSIKTIAPKQGGIFSNGTVNFITKDATLVGATIVAPTLMSETNGDIRLLPSYVDQKVFHKETKSRFLGKTTVTYEQSSHIPVGSNVLVNNFLMLGAGELEMVGVTAKLVNATITKNIKERAAYEESKTVITQRSSGFCPPKINGDCFVNSIKNLTNGTTCFIDSLSCTLSLLGSTCQTLNDIKILSNLATIPNPTMVITKMLLNRFVSGFIYTNMKQVTTVEETKPHQGNFEIEVLRVSNDRTHLEGVWNIKNRAEIETKEFTTKAPEHKVHTHTKTTGFSISLNPLALGAACIHPGILTIGASLPSIGVSSSTIDKKTKDNYAQVLTADDLFIRCDNAVFSGSKIHGRLIECIVSGDLKIEDMMSEFESVEKGYNFNVSLSSIFSLVKSFHDKSLNNYHLKEEIKNIAKEKGIYENNLTNTTFLHPIFGTIPQMRFAEEKTMKREVQNLASLIGKEKFYLHVANVLHKKNALVGIVAPDGVVANTENEKIEAGKILEEKVQQTYHHERHVYNPCLSEFVNMMSSFQSWRKTVEDFELTNYEKALKENKTVRQAKLDAKLKTKEFLQQLDQATKDQLDGFLYQLLLYDKHLTAKKEAGQYDGRFGQQKAESHPVITENQPKKSNQQDKSPRTNQQDKSPRSNQQDKSPKSSQQDKSPRSDQQDKSPRSDQQETNYQGANEMQDFNNNIQSETNASNVLYITDENGEQIIPDSISLEQAEIIHSRLPFENVSIQEIAILVQYTRNKLSDPEGKRYPFLTETTFIDSIQRLYAEDMLKYRDLNWSDSKCLDYALYKVFKGIAVFGEFLVKHQEFIDSCFEFVSYSNFIFPLLEQIKSKAYQFGSKIARRSYNKSNKKIEFKEEDVFDYKFSCIEKFFDKINEYRKNSCDYIRDKYQEYVIKFATSVTDDDRVSDQIIRAGKVLPDIVKNGVNCYFTFSGKKFSKGGLIKILKPGRSPFYSNLQKAANLNRRFHTPHNPSKSFGLSKQTTKPANLNRTLKDINHPPHNSTPTLHTTTDPEKNFGFSKPPAKPANLNRPFNDDPPPRPPANSSAIPKQQPQPAANMNRKIYIQPENKSKIQQNFEDWKAAQNMK